MFCSTTSMIVLSWIEWARWSMKSDEKTEAREEQQDCTGDREPRKLLDAATAGYADCVKPRHTVGEGRDEHV